MWVDSFRREVERHRQELARLQERKAQRVKKIADLSKRILDAQQSASRSSASVAQSKYRDVVRYQNDLSREQQELSRTEDALSNQQKRLHESERRLDKAVQEDATKRTRAQERAAREQEQRLRRIDDAVHRHERLHVQTLSRLERLRSLPDVATVLFFAANPLDQPALRLDEEVRAITEMIRKAEHRDALQLVSRWAVRPGDLLQAINEHDPRVVHFSGHGTDGDEIVFQDSSGNAKFVSKSAIVQTMAACSANIRLVFFNTCYSTGQAEAVVAHVDAAIGMSTSIGDEAARVFAAQFYSAIGFSKTVSDAFQQAKAALMLEDIPEEDTPELFIQPGCDPLDLILIKPPELSLS